MPLLRTAAVGVLQHLAGSNHHRAVAGQLILRAVHLPHGVRCCAVNRLAHSSGLALLAAAPMRTASQRRSESGWYAVMIRLDSTAAGLSPRLS